MTFLKSKSLAHPHHRTAVMVSHSPTPPDLPVRPHTLHWLPTLLLYQSHMHFSRRALTWRSPLGLLYVRRLHLQLLHALTVLCTQCSHRMQSPHRKFPLRPSAPRKIIPAKRRKLSRSVYQKNHQMAMAAHLSAIFRIPVPIWYAAHSVWYGIMSSVLVKTPAIMVSGVATHAAHCPCPSMTSRSK